MGRRDLANGVGGQGRGGVGAAGGVPGGEGGTVTRAARTPAEAGGGEEAIKREAGRAPRQKERSSGPARRGRCTGTQGRAAGLCREASALV